MNLPPFPARITYASLTFFALSLLFFFNRIDAMQPPRKNTHNKVSRMVSPALQIAQLKERLEEEARARQHMQHQNELERTTNQATIEKQQTIINALLMQLHYAQQKPSTHIVISHRSPERVRINGIEYYYPQKNSR